MVRCQPQRELLDWKASRSEMPCVDACGAAVPRRMQAGSKRRHVAWGSSRRTALAATREFANLRKHKQ